MQALGFYLALPFLYLISLLPFPVLYLFSDVFFLLVYYVIGYRKKVVTQNLKNSFPEKREDEIISIRKKFYRHLCDVSLEMVKTLAMSKEAMIARCRMDDKIIQLVDQLYKERKNLVLVVGHFGNWEWGNHAFSLQCKHPMYGIYHPLENKYFNRLTIRMRTRFGTRLLTMESTFREMVRNRKQLNATSFIADQTPAPENAYWVKFLNQDTPVFRGTEVIARILDYPVLFFNIKKVKRGYYEISGEMICEHPAATSEGEITEMHTRKLEAAIQQAPETWLWSHRRWKHQRP
jgi:Kdo2-lipid IVA lauroyltransferase/acyltransferase